MNWKQYIPVMVMFAMFVIGLLLVTPALNSISTAMQSTNAVLEKMMLVMDKFTPHSDTTLAPVNVSVSFDKLAAKLNSRIEYVTVHDTVNNVVYDSLKVAIADSILTLPITVIRNQDTTRHEITQHLYIQYDGTVFNTTSELSALYINDSTMTITKSIPLWQIGAAAGVGIVTGVLLGNQITK